MGLRKQPPPRLQNISKPYARADARSPKSASAHSPSSSHQSHIKRLPSEDPIYSPDLNTSPAFDLMPLEQAQRSPVGSPTRSPPHTWSDSGRPDNGGAAQYGHNDQNNGTYQDPATNPGNQVPHPLIPGQYTGASENVWQSHHNNGDASMGELPVQLQSNNPFLKPRSAEHTQDLLERNDWGRTSQATTNSEALSHSKSTVLQLGIFLSTVRETDNFTADGYIPMTARLSLLDQTDQDTPWDEPSRPHFDQHAVLDGHHLEDNSPWESQKSPNVSNSRGLFLQEAQSNSYDPPVVVEPVSSHNGSGYPHTQDNQPYQTHSVESDTGFRTPSAVPSNGTSATSHYLIDLDVPGMNPNHDAGSRAGSSLYSEQASKEPNLLSDARSQNPASPTEQPWTASQKHESQPARVLSPEEAARQKEQRSETYTIRHVRWTNQAGELLESPILVQNQNGPCPLLALINALVLRASPTAHPPIVRALKTREQISLGLLIEAMFEELTTCLGPDEEFPDIEALAQFLTMLHTGMNVNPRLTLESTDGLGTFLETSDLRLYSTFRIPLIHAWLASWSSPTHAAMSRTGQYYDDIQMLPFRRQELEDRATRGDSLSFEEESTMADIQSIQQFVEIENATQLSPFGLTQLSTRLLPGSVSILFRNDHFSTLYKHPQSHQLYTLVTDAGYASHAEVVWESLVDVTGFNTEYYSGDFRPVGAGSSAGPAEPAPSNPAGPRTSSVPTSPSPNPTTSDTAQSTEPTQEQSDADYAYALSLQFEEEQRENERTQDGNASRNSAQSNPPRGPSPSARMSNVPTRSSSTATGLRRPRPQPNNGPDPDDPNAPPPPYEQAAGGPRYSPPDRRPYSGAQGNQYPGRNSRNNSQYAHRPRPSVASSTDRMGRDRNKDCVVM
ncbi:unnamed protein product [Penicillium olsonii]|uniref:MINDY deubiquitinase domain-containing protein n=1 Tax=Penicillium olsonii TaxID=99116 RepID=A0A9W4N282_PENOL|nr:unnamed protein product [Penicillium olsonii]CAG8261793.1 unnamed protein product [Penicillium olsonii]